MKINYILVLLFVIVSFVVQNPYKQYGYTFMKLDRNYKVDVRR